MSLIAALDIGVLGLIAYGLVPSERGPPACLAIFPAYYFFHPVPEPFP